MSKKTSDSNNGRMKEDETSTEEFDWCSVYPLQRIKTQLQNQDDNIGALPKKTLSLISHCSALLVRNIVQQSLAAKEENNQDDDNKEKKKPAAIVVLSAQDLREGIERDETLQFLTECVEAAMEKEDGKLAPPKRQPKRKQPTSSTSTTTITKASKLASTMTQSTSGLDNASLEEAMEVSQRTPAARDSGQIIVDEEDYD